MKKFAVIWGIVFLLCLVVLCGESGTKMLVELLGEGSLTFEEVQTAIQTGADIYAHDNSDRPPLMWPTNSIKMLRF